MYQVSCQYSGKIFIARTKRKKGVRLCRTLSRSGLSKTALNAVLHGSRFPKPCAPAQGRVPYTRAAAQAAALRLLYHISKLTLRVPLVFTKKHGIYAARLMLRLRLAFTNRTYYTMTPRSGLGKTALAAVLHVSMSPGPCAPAHPRVLRTRAAAAAAALRLLYHKNMKKRLQTV